MSVELRQQAEERIGQRIADKYHLRAVLGVGGMGVVFSAWHQFTERMVALKVLHPSIAAAPTHAQRFLQEATASAAIRHPGIAEVLDAGREADGSLYVAFELLEGEDLGHAIMGGRVAPRRMLEIAVDVLDPLDAAHAKGVIHRDIKPANIFLVSDRQAPTPVKLLDFGIARRARSRGTDGLTQAGTIVGTPYYMSPEQMCGEAVDGRADLWALAVVVYYGLTGQLPFQGRSYIALLTEMLQKGPPSLPDLTGVPTGVEAVLKRALAPRIEDRYQAAIEMQLALRAVLPAPPQPESSTPPPPSAVVAGARRPPGPGSSQGTPESGPTPAGPTKIEPRWVRALADVEGEIAALKAKKPKGRGRGS